MAARPGDILITRQPAGLATAGEWQYVLEVLGESAASRCYSRYDLAASDGEQLAAQRRVRLIYVQRHQQLLLMDYRENP